MTDETTRAARLLDAQAKAVRLFAEIEARGLVAPGEGERAVSDRIRYLGERPVRSDAQLAQAHRPLRTEHPPPGP